MRAIVSLHIIKFAFWPNVVEVVAAKRYSRVAFSATFTHWYIQWYTMMLLCSFIEIHTSVGVGMSFKIVKIRPVNSIGFKSVGSSDKYITSTPHQLNWDTLYIWTTKKEQKGRDWRAAMHLPCTEWPLLSCCKKDKCLAYSDFTALGESPWHTDKGGEAMFIPKERFGDFSGACFHEP